MRFTCKKPINGIPRAGIVNVIEHPNIANHYRIEYAAGSCIFYTIADDGILDQYFEDGLGHLPSMHFKPTGINAPFLLQLTQHTDWVSGPDGADFANLEFNRPKINCEHAWKKYIGFTDTFTYCEKCDAKK